MAWCEHCAGTGKISCGACWAGQSKPMCPDCSGRGSLAAEGGEIACRRCHGTGRVSPQSCPDCGNSSICPDCGGSGSI